jgi:hypothetical protein
MNRLRVLWWCFWNLHLWDEIQKRCSRKAYFGKRE